MEQNGRTIALVLTINNEVDIVVGQLRASDFIRTVKRFADREEPQPENLQAENVGRSVYDYIVLIIRPDQSEVGFGTKDRNAERIVWEFP